MKRKKVKIALCQMPVIPGRPDLNTAYMEREIAQVEESGAEILVFPEMCISGYLIGDLFEDEHFIMDVMSCNDRILYATKERNVTVIFGSINSTPGTYGEDGRPRKHNAIFVAQKGVWLYQGEKTLHPNYRIFDDDRHFYSKRKIREFLEDETEKKISIEDLFNVVDIKINGGVVKVGIMVCEDMWNNDYSYDPPEILTKKGAELLINISASPWTWQKNRKRHAVVKELAVKSQTPLVYVNNVGVQNNGKNIVIFDGSSTIYNSVGDIAMNVPPFFSGVQTFDLSWNMPAVEQITEDDTTQLYQALQHGVEKFLETVPKERRKMIIGLSGGIDSALAAAFYVDILGPQNVFLYNLPTRFNGEETKLIAAQIAQNLGAHYEVIPIQTIVDSVAEAVGCDPEKDDLSYENIQARVRMEVLASKAQLLGGLFSCNSNKVETAFGYATLYGDIAGYLAVFGDLVKREVYQLADYFNQVVYQREVIPTACFDIAPKAELKRDQVDPFDYGNVHRRGYHDEMVRAFTEFRWNPEMFAEKYVSGDLESSLKLDQGTLDRLFPDPQSFILDLETRWRSFVFSVNKRVQAPPIPIVNRRAFGYDLRESLLSSHFTSRYFQLKDLILGESQKNDM